MIIATTKRAKKGGVCFIVDLERKKPRMIKERKKKLFLCLSHFQHLTENYAKEANAG